MQKTKVGALAVVQPHFRPFLFVNQRECLLSPHSSDSALPARWPFPGSLDCAPLSMLWMHHFMHADKHIRCFAKADSRD